LRQAMNPFRLKLLELDGFKYLESSDSTVNGYVLSEPHLLFLADFDERSCLLRSTHFCSSL
jgi:hypothetical protein